MSQSPQVAIEPRPTQSSPWRLPIFLLVIAGLLGLVVWAALQFSRAGEALSRGKTLLRQRREPEAEREFDKYLWLYPRDPEAILLWAEAVITSDRRDPQEAARLVNGRLNDIPDTSPFGAEARMREGRLALLILHQPDRAEKLLTRSVELNSELADTHYLLWKLLDMTERFHYSEEHFWKTYELSPEELKSERLRDWYLSQFSPGTANSELDRRMGFLPAGKLPGDDISMERLNAFLANEPQAAMVVTAKARLLMHLREHEEALRLLLEISESNEALCDPQYLSALVTVLIDLGRTDEVRKYFETWPQSAGGFIYWHTAGLVFDVVDRDDTSAVKAYDSALSVWPGPAEWSIMHRKAQCLARLGDRTGADAVRDEARRIELLMETEVHQKLRLAMADLTNPEALQQMVRFYLSLRREREAKCWQDAIDRLPLQTGKVYSPR